MGNRPSFPSSTWKRTGRRAAWRPWTSEPSEAVRGIAGQKRRRKGVSVAPWGCVTSIYALDVLALAARQRLAAEHTASGRVSGGSRLRVRGCQTSAKKPVNGPRIDSIGRL
jgi:hypothetical protein